MHVISLLVLLVSFSTVALAEDDICARYASEYRQAENVEYIDDHKVSADLNSIKTPVVPIKIPITLDLNERYNLGLPNDLELETAIAYLEVMPNGDVIYNGQNLTKNIEDICAQKDDDNGQERSDPLQSGVNIKNIEE